MVRPSQENIKKYGISFFWYSPPKDVPRKAPIGLHYYDSDDPIPSRFSHLPAGTVPVTTLLLPMISSHPPPLLLRPLADPFLIPIFHLRISFIPSILQFFLYSLLHFSLTSSGIFCTKKMLALQLFPLAIIFVLIQSFFGFVDGKRKCFRRLRGTRTFVPVEGLSEDGGLPGGGEDDDTLQRLGAQQGGIGTSFRTGQHDVYLWPSLADHEKAVIREAFHQIHRRTCIRFNELDYKPWYHAERWAEGKPYVVIRKSKKFSGYSDNNIEDVNRRSLIYLSEKSLNSPAWNTSRGMVMEQLLRFMGFREEYLRPDAPSYIQPIQGAIRPAGRPNPPKFSNEQLLWPFDPESITMPWAARDWFRLTIYCQARENADIGAGQRAGLLTRWDVVKLNSMYCPQIVGFADPRMGPCAVPRMSRSHNQVVDN